MQNPQTSSTANDTDTDDERLVGVPSHPVAAVVGAIATGGATGAVVGTAAGPVGTVIGAVVGAVAGALGGDAIASSFDQADERYWRESFASRPYVSAGSSFDDYGPAYAFGDGARRRYETSSFDDVDAELAGEWPGTRGRSMLDWHEARHAARDAWDRSGERLHKARP